MPVLPFIAASAGAAVMISLASLVWPILSSDPRPEALTRVREAVVSTEIGRNTAQVLGVSDESSVVPVSVSTLVARGVSTVVGNVTKSAQRAVTSRLLESLADQFETLPEEEKEVFRAEICAPTASGLGATQQEASSAEPQ